MARYIDADAIDKRYVPIAPVVDWGTVHYEWVAFIDDINELPTIDAIPIEWILNNERMPTEGKGHDAIIDMIADWKDKAEPMRHGKWRFVNCATGLRCQCSECLHWVDAGTDKNYCPNCGARMDEE